MLLFIFFRTLCSRFVLENTGFIRIYQGEKCLGYHSFDHRCFDFRIDMLFRFSCYVVGGRVAFSIGEDNHRGRFRRHTSKSVKTFFKNLLTKFDYCDIIYM